MGIPELILLGGLILTGVAVYFFVASVISNNTDDDVLSWSSSDEPVKSKSAIIELCRPLVHQFTIQHALRIKSKSYRKKVERKILTGGLSSELNVDEFIGLQILWGVFLPAFLLIFNFALELGYNPMFMGLLGLAGMYYPHMYCASEKRQREVSVQVDLPFFIDILALSTEAGLDFISSIQRIVDKAEDSVLAEEFGRVMKDIKLGSARGEALKAMSARLDIAEVTSFVAVLVDADSTGAPIAGVLKDQSVQMRLERMVRAEKAGAKASQSIMIPMMVFILPAVFIMVFGPVILQFLGGGG